MHSPLSLSWFCIHLCRELILYLPHTLLPMPEVGEFCLPHTLLPSLSNYLCRGSSIYLPHTLLKLPIPEILQQESSLLTSHPFAYPWEITMQGSSLFTSYPSMQGISGFTYVPCSFLCRRRVCHWRYNPTHASCRPNSWQSRSPWGSSPPTWTEVGWPRPQPWDPGEEGGGERGTIVISWLHPLKPSRFRVMLCTHLEGLQYSNPIP